MAHPKPGETPVSAGFRCPPVPLALPANPGSSPTAWGRSQPDTNRTPTPNKRGEEWTLSTPPNNRDEQEDPHHPINAPEIPHPRTPSQITAESAAYWAPIVAAMDPMTPQELADVVIILRRITDRIAAQEQ